MSYTPSLSISRAISIFPSVSQSDFEALKEISSWKERKFETSGLARCIRKDIDTVAETGADRVMIEGPCSMAFAKLFDFKDEDDIIARFVDSIKYAQSLGLKVSAEPWDAGKSDLRSLEKFYKTIAETGVDQAIIADTYNNLMPWSVYQIVKMIYQWTDNKMVIVPHFHNDFGLALASTLAAVAAGSTIVHCALNAVGEKAGNAATEEVAVALELLMGVESGIDLSYLNYVCKKMESISKLPIPPSKPVTGTRIHDMGSGIAVDWYTKMDSDFDRAVQFPFLPSLIGAPPPRIAWGKGCGANMVAVQAKSIGIELTKEQASAIRDEIKKESLIRKDLLDVHQVNQMIRQATK